MLKRCIAGIDLGFRHTGIVIGDPVKLTLSGYEVINSLCIHTEKADKKHKVYVSDDDVRCCQEMINKLDEMISLHEVAALAVEMPSGGGKGARALRCMGMASGMIAAYTEIKRLPVVWVRPEDIKKKVGGAGNASKKDIQNSIRELFPGFELPTVEKSREHVADAAAALIVARDTDIYKLLVMKQE